MHLVQVDVGVRCSEERLANGRQFNLGVGELPDITGSTLDGAAEGAAENLMAEADPMKSKVGVSCPCVCSDHVRSCHFDCGVEMIISDLESTGQAEGSNRPGYGRRTCCR